MKNLPTHCSYSREELESLDEFVANCQKTRNYFEVIHEADDEILCVIVLMPSPLSRSERSVHFGGPIAVNPKYRGKGRQDIYFVLPYALP